MICGMVSSCIMVLRKQKVKATFKTSFPLEMSEQGWEPGCVHLNPFKRREGVCVLRSVFPGDWEPPPLTEFNVLCKDQDGSQLNHERKKPGTPSLTQLHSGGIDSFYIICLMSAETQSSHWDFIYICVYTYRHLVASRSLIQRWIPLPAGLMEMWARAVQEGQGVLYRTKPQSECSGQLL